MFDRSIIENDYFMDLPIGSKALYFLLGMEADDEGFVSTKRVLKLYGGTVDDIKVLITKNFLIPFESGVVVITDWKTNNWLDSRRIKATRYQLEKSLLECSKTQYKLKSAKPMLSEYSIEENSIVQNNKKKQFKKPSLEEVTSYCEERNNNFSPTNFLNFYESKGWMIGKNKMTDWKACVRTWESKNKSNKTKATTPKWFDKEVKQKQMTETEVREMEEMMKEFKEER